MNHLVNCTLQSSSLREAFKKKTKKCRGEGGNRVCFFCVVHAFFLFLCYFLPPMNNYERFPKVLFFECFLSLCTIRVSSTCWGQMAAWTANTEFDEIRNRESNTAWNIGIIYHETRLESRNKLSYWLTN